VSKYVLNKAELKTKYKQIIGFYFVSSLSGTGIEKLAENIRDVTLHEKYIGELIPVLFYFLVEIP
jgi:hypothetical protein